MSELRFDGKVALVTGGGRGIGRGHALLLAARGARVVVNDPGADLDGGGSDSRPAAQVVAEIVAAGGKAVANFDSVATEEGARAMVEQAVSAFGRIDIVINNAGNFLAKHPFAETSRDTFEKIWRVHLMGTVNVIRAAWPHMTAQRYGRIVNTASHSGYLGSRGNLEYSVAKSAIHGLTRTLSLEAESYGIAVNAVAPGGMTRPVTSHHTLPESFTSGAFDPNLVAPTVIWLAHEDCKVNGEIFGGMGGATTRIRIAETKGFVSRTPTPEAIRDHFDAILDESTLAASGLTFETEAELHGGAVVERFLALS
jgi:NAD(P)-dependent dehydrogenase (short-subunit alcohol dehydrogenase family)